MTRPSCGAVRPRLGEKIGTGQRPKLPLSYVVALGDNARSHEVQTHLI